MTKEINTCAPEHTHRLSLAGRVGYCELDTFQSIADRLVELAGGSGVPRVEPITPDAEEPSDAPAPKPVSDFGGELHVDGEAKVRIEAQHASLQASGVAVDVTEQYYATGTRMAQVGYDTQAERKAEHDRMLPAREAAQALADRVRAEKRRDVEISAAELGRSIETNGKIRGAGFALSEQAIRGLLARLGSPALGYVLGVRERIADEVRDARAEGVTPNRERIQADKNRITETLQHECQRYGDVALKLRAREALGDCFAIVSPGYTPADAPELLDRVVDRLPTDARASVAYDPTSTTWELRADVWTPTPVAEQAVGEPFRGYVSFSSRDNGTRSFRGGGGIELIRCLNASTYVAEGRSTRRRHTGEILVDVAEAIEGGLHAIEALTRAWGLARKQAIDVGEGLALTDVIPDLWTSLLTERRGMLAGVLPGRSAEHAQALAKAYFQERRDPSRLVKADLAQGWTRYVQDQPGDVRREAEQAVGAWMVHGSVPRIEARA